MNSKSSSSLKYSLAAAWPGDPEPDAEDLAEDEDFDGTEDLPGWKNRTKAKHRATQKSTHKPRKDGLS